LEGIRKLWHGMIAHPYLAARQWGATSVQKKPCFRKMDCTINFGWLKHIWDDHPQREIFFGMGTASQSDFVALIQFGHSHYFEYLRGM
jgi:hypothetical protein